MGGSVRSSDDGALGCAVLLGVALAVLVGWLAWLAVLWFAADWRWAGTVAIPNTPVTAACPVAVPIANNEDRSYDAKSGTVLWQGRLGEVVQSGFSASPVGVDGKLVSSKITAVRDLVPAPRTPTFEASVSSIYSPVPIEQDLTRWLALFDAPV